MKREKIHFESSFEEFWPIYAAGAFIYLVIHLFSALGLIPFWVTWIPIVLLSLFAVVTWFSRKLRKFLATREYSDGERP